MKQKVIRLIPGKNPASSLSDLTDRSEGEPI
jgi:hypothetical protein